MLTVVYLCRMPQTSYYKQIEEFKITVLDHQICAGCMYSNKAQFSKERNALIHLWSENVSSFLRRIILILVCVK